MLNEVENNVVQDAASDLEQTKSQMMRYRTNGISYILGFGGIIFSILGAFVCLNSMNPNKAFVIAKILMNILILLFGFMCCEKVKNYSKASSITMIGIGAVCIARIFWIPLQILTTYSQYVTANNKYNDLLLNSPNNKEEIARLRNQIAELKNSLGGTITYKVENSAFSISWLPASGTFRGILAIVLFCLAASCFIASGIIGYIKAKRLADYMASINEGQATTEVSSQA